MKTRETTRLLSHPAIFGPGTEVALKIAIDRRDIHDVVVPDDPTVTHPTYSRHQTGVGVGVIAERLASEWGYRLTAIEGVREDDDLVELQALATARKTAREAEQ